MKSISNNFDIYYHSQPTFALWKPRTAKAEIPESSQFSIKKKNASGKPNSFVHRIQKILLARKPSS
jgi:hypothetical protein